MRKGEIRKRMESRGYTITSWARSIGLSTYDINIISKINNNLYKGGRGRSKEVRAILIKWGFMDKEDSKKCG